jgi:hypothetical protein
MKFTNEVAYKILETSTGDYEKLLNPLRRFKTWSPIDCLSGPNKFISLGAISEINWGGGAKVLLSSFLHEMSIFSVLHVPLIGLAQRYSAGLRDGRSGVLIPVGSGNFSLHHRVQIGSGPTQPPIQWVPGALSLVVKRPGREADHSPPSSAKVRMRGAIPPLPQFSFMAWCSIKAQGQLCLYLSTVSFPGGKEAGV